MSDIPKFKTFADLRSIPSKTADLQKEGKAESNSASHTQPSQPTKPITPNQDNQPYIPNQPNLNKVFLAPPVSSSATQADASASAKSVKTRSAKQNMPKTGENPSLQISPEKDFSKVPNSIARQAIPERVFKGLSKHTYDALYLKTRGAINPTRRIRATKSDLLRWTGVSDVTVDKHINHLKTIGLLRVELVRGSHEGNWYEVFVPEEIKGFDKLLEDGETRLSYPTNPTNIDIPNPTKKVGGSPPNFLGGVGGVYFVENKGIAQNPKTIYKTIYDDEDEALEIFTQKLGDSLEELTGKRLSRTDAENWGKLADLLILELNIAAKRTGTISNVPAFLTEVLRRKLLISTDREKTEKVSGAGKSESADNFSAKQKLATFKKDEVGRGAEEEYEIKPLSEEEFDKALAQLREFADDTEFIKDFEKWYTPEDWQKLTENLKKS